MKTISATEAAGQLAVSLPTLYAYVSRGLIRSTATATAGSRERRYSLEDIERLKSRRETRRDPAKAIAGALHWGAPLLDSAITLMSDERIFYRGHDSVSLAMERSVEDVASLLWTGAFDPPLFPASPTRIAPRRSPGIAAAHMALAAAAEADPAAFDTRPSSVAATGARIVTLLTLALSGAAKAEPSIVTMLATAWRLRERRSQRVLNAALILCADHELNISSFTARCIASAGSHPYAVVSGALGALQGVRHGGLTSRVEALLDEVSRSSSPASAIRARLERGEEIPGFGHPLYLGGDPRAHALLGMLAPLRNKEYDRLMEIRSAAHELLGEHPTIDFALAAAARVLKLPSGSPFALFAIGRSLGWIAHAIEQYGEKETIRPRARYTGPAPRE
jgi:citrate synthase